MKRTILFSVIIIVLLFSAVYAHFILTVHPVMGNTIYRSAQLSERRLQKNIKKYKFKSIINLRGKDKEEKWYQRESKIAKKNNISLYDVRLSAYKLPISSELDTLIDTLKTAKKPLLLHCQAGSDRSGLASALALSIQKDAPLHELKNQFSWKYFINPFRSQSCGKLFFSYYERYLDQTGIDHSRNHLLHWIENKYIDYKGNIEFVIERADSNRFDHSQSEDRRSVFIQQGTEKVLLKGWAFDYRRKQPINYLGVSIEDTLRSLAHFTTDRQDVANHYRLEKKDFKDFKFGWVADMPIRDLRKGCYKISLYVGENEKEFRFIEDAGYDLCIKR